MQCVQGGTDDTITDTGKPTGTVRTALEHVEAQHLDEQHFGKFGQHPRATWPRRARLIQRVANRRLKPHAGIGATHINAYNRRQPRQQHPREARIAGQIAAHQASSRAAAAIRQLARATRQYFAQTAPAFRWQQAGGRGHAVRVPLREKHHITCAQM